MRRHLCEMWGIPHWHPPCCLARRVGNRGKRGMKSISRSHGFTRLELLVVIIAVSALVSLSFSLCANTRDRSERVVCQNNLRQIGRAFHIWATDHSDRNPWLVPITEGGTGGSGPGSFVLRLPGVGSFGEVFRHNAWFQYLWVYEGLPSPAVLACPADKAKRVAKNFSMDRNSGLAGLGHQDLSVSYVVGLHAKPDVPSSVLAADRHLTPVGPTGAGGCFTGLRNVRPLRISPGMQAASWGPRPHPFGGNVLLNDAQVREFSESEMNTFLQGTRLSGAGNEEGIHLLYPASL